MKKAALSYVPPIKRVLMIVFLIALVGFATAEHMYRRVVTHQFLIENERRVELEAEHIDLVKSKRELNFELDATHSKISELSEKLAQSEDQVLQVTARLDDESQTVKKLKTKLASMQNQLSQLQGEMSLMVSESSGDRDSSTRRAVHLERIIVSADLDQFQGRVLSVDDEWDFIVVNMGWDKVKIGDTISVYRDEDLLAKARIERVQEDVAAATVLPKWKETEISVNDIVRNL